VTFINEIWADDNPMQAERRCNVDKEAEELLASLTSD
jgi:hypothetical protein